MQGLGVFLLPKGTCVVPCVRDAAPIESKDMTAPETCFWDTLWALVEAPRMLSYDSVCRVVGPLDAMVREGSVARGRAAVMCNAMSTRDDYAHSPLWSVVHPVHAFRCQERCLEKVLAWGMCPHVREHHVKLQRTFGPMYGYSASWAPRGYIQTLWIHGAFPCNIWHRDGVCAAHMYPTTHPVFCAHGGPNGDGPFVQWRRWHARLRKRQWLKMAGTLRHNC